MYATKTALALILVCMLPGCSPAASGRSVSDDRSAAQTPRDATYLIDGKEYALRDGQATVAMVPGAASNTVIQIFGEPANGDLDNDGLADAAVLLVETTGGSGTFYHVTAALNHAGAFVGTRAVFIGDRIAPRLLTVRHGVVILDYADRRPRQAMATPPSLQLSKYLTVRNANLEELFLADGEVIAAGEVVIGHEVRSFTPCGADDAAWLVGDSPALPAMQLAYHRVMSDAPPYTPLFMVLAGQPLGQPADGFGADYPAGFRVSQLVHILANRSCVNLEQPSE
jgi:hypothetical protein